MSDQTEVYAGASATNEAPIYKTGSLTYQIAGIADDGSLIFRTSSGATFTIDPARDFQEVIREGLAQGIFAEFGSVESNPTGTVLRSEAIFELWRILGDGTSVDDSAYEGIDEVAGVESYYRPAVVWLYSKNPDLVENLYTYRDLEGAITWLEVAYLLYCVLDFPSTIPWKKIRPNQTRVTVITNQTANGRKLEMRLSEYRPSKWMRTYLREMRTGARYIPFPAYCAFVNMVADGHLPSKKGIVSIGTELVEKGTNVDADSANWCLLEVSREDFFQIVSKIAKISIK